jgi:hypothetical protein
LRGIPDNGPEKAKIEGRIELKIALFGRNEIQFKRQKNNKPAYITAI